MILQLKHLQGKAAGVTTHEVVDALYALLEGGHLEQDQFAHLRVHLDWIQYRQNFRECVMAIKASTGRHDQSPAFELHIDVRHATSGGLRARIQRTVGELSGESQTGSEPVLLEEFRSFRESVAWEFNRLHWHRCRIGNSSPGVDMSRHCRAEALLIRRRRKPEKEGAKEKVAGLAAKLSARSCVRKQTERRANEAPKNPRERYSHECPING